MNIAIKLPNDLNQRILTFPFLHALEKYMKAHLEEEEILKIHLISLVEGIDVLNLLPFNAFYHEVERTDLKTVFSIHRACMNFKIDQIDIFISTTDSFVDASIGKNLMANKKVGFAIGKNTWLLNEKVNKLNGRHFSEQCFELLRPLVEEMPEMPNVFSRELAPFYIDWSENPYIVINLRKENDKICEEWFDFFDLFVNKNFVLMCTDEELDYQKGLLEDFVKRLPGKNTYKVYEHKSHIEFGKIISYCKYFISYDSPLVNLAAYCGANILHLNEKEKVQLTGSQYFVGDVRHFSLSDPLFKAGNTFNYTKIFDEIFVVLDGKSGDSEDD